MCTFILTIRTIKKGLNFKSIDSIETKRFELAKTISSNFSILAYNEKVDVDNEHYGTVYELSNGQRI